MTNDRSGPTGQPRTFARLVMTASAALLTGIGAVLTFASREAAVGLDFSAPAAEISLEMLGALCLGTGMTNWMSRRNLLGGIYGRPLGVGNMVHFVVGSFALQRVAGTGSMPQVAWPLFVIYLLFALSFAWIVFGGRAAFRPPSRC